MGDDLMIARQHVDALDPLAPQPLHAATRSAPDRILKRQQADRSIHDDRVLERSAASQAAGL